MFNEIKASFLEEELILKNFIENEKNFHEIAKLAKSMVEIYKLGGKILIAGNGGSCCDAMHFAEELTGRFRGNRKALGALALADASHITCVGNDFGFDAIFERGVEAYGREGDMFIGISTSGNSKNIELAIKKAKSLRMSTVGVLGKDGGKIKGLCDYEFIVEGKTSDRIQEVHMMILHIVIEALERELFPENY
ncbi:MAG: SIS domain-containing protein [Fusobacteria bacterium]|nr:SIS domain-containing protein [Fusobacteriota bacterium]